MTWEGGIKARLRLDNCVSCSQPLTLLYETFYYDLSRCFLRSSLPRSLVLLHKLSLLCGFLTHAYFTLSLGHKSLRSDKMSVASSDLESSRSTTPVSPVAIDPDAVTTSSLQALQSDDQRKVMDIVDKLRRTGLSGVVELPQLVVSSIRSCTCCSHF